MHCPSCGQENNDLATRCSHCGSILPEPQATHQDQDDTVAQPEPVLEDDPTTPQPQPAADPEGTEERTWTPEESPPAPKENPELREVAKVTENYISAKRNRFSQFFGNHQKAMGIGLALLVVAIVGGAWFILSTTNTPSYQQIEDDLSKLLTTYEYTGGTYGPDLEIPLSSVTVTKREATQVPQDLSEDSVSPTAYSVEAEATFDDDAIRAVRNVGVTYVLTEDGWSIAGEPTEQGVSYMAQAGVDEDKVLENMGMVLNEAAQPGDTSLADIYGEGDFSIENSDFNATPQDDTATDDVVIRCERQQDFSSYDGTITAHFAFESGKWSLRKAEASSGATTRSFDPLVGTWHGQLVDQSAKGANCYGARGEELVVTIDSVGDSALGKGQVKGTVSALAHFHKQLEKNQESTSGDELLEDFPFAGTISTNRDSATGSDLTVTCTTSGNARGEVSFVLVFGTDDDPSAAMAKVTSTHTYDEMVLGFIPSKTTAQFTDTYVLSKE
ncbi:MAG: zinc ribbon domain-containing protein [Coriobacteriales bacterium]|nr:zinc ribbon domain-containing protein [Coriobacteriales bacterium]